MDDERFWRKVDKSGECWLWTGADNGVGYGKVRRPALSDQSIYTHYYAWFLTHGRWPEYICHRCDNRACCRPSHLYEGTPKTNQQDRIRAGNGNEGSKHGMSKLTEAKVRRIRQLLSKGETLTSVAANFGVSPSAICHITHGRTWGHI
jgi:hypothetical protein